MSLKIGGWIMLVAGFGLLVLCIVRILEFVDGASKLTGVDLGYMLGWLIPGIIILFVLGWRAIGEKEEE